MAELGSLFDARQVIDQLDCQKGFSWNSIFEGHPKSRNPRDALTLYQRMGKNNSLLLSGYVYLELLKTCTKLKDLESGMEIHANVATAGFLKNDIFVGNALIHMYARCGSVDKAQQVFYTLHTRDVVSWTTLIAGYLEQGFETKALRVFKCMQLNGIPPNSVTYIHILKACAAARSLKMGEKIYTEIELKGLSVTDITIGNCLIDMYIKCGSLNNAQNVFEKLPNRNATSWTIMITGYTDYGYYEEALNGLDQMALDGIFPDLFSYACSLKVCGNMRDPEKAKRIHGEVQKKGLEDDHFICNALVDMYAKCGLIIEARDMLDRIDEQDVISWTSLISGYGECDANEEVLYFFERMQLQGIFLNAVTLICALKTCVNVAAIVRGRRIHALIRELGLLEKDVVLANSLVDVYMKCGVLIEAQKVFDIFQHRDACLWTTLISGYLEHGETEKALKYFEQMQLEGFSPDITAFSCILKSCTLVGDANDIRRFHVDLEKKGFCDSEIVGSALVDVYGKCGMLIDAQDVFDRLPAPSTMSWNALIGGYAEHGGAEHALICLETMKVQGIYTNSLTFLYSLKACCSIRSINEGTKVHKEIEKKGIAEDNLVGNKLVDMYAKCGALNTAVHIFGKLLVKDTVSWNALIMAYAESGCNNQALTCFKQMQLNNARPNVITFIGVLKASLNLSNFCSAAEIIDEIEMTGLLEKDEIYGSSIVNMYAKQGLLAKAQEVFDKLTLPNVVSWTALIEGYSHYGDVEAALECLQQMQQNGIPPNEITYVCSLKACGSSETKHRAHEIHADVVKKGLSENNAIVGSALVDTYAKSGFLEEAHGMLMRLPVPNVVSWTALISGYAKHGCNEKVLECFEQMCHGGVSPDALTLHYSLRACSSLNASSKAHIIHAEIVKKGVCENCVDVLISMYVKFGSMVTAHQLLHKFPSRDVTSWNALIAQYTDHGYLHEVRKCLHQMKLEGVSPNNVTFVSILKAFDSTRATKQCHMAIGREGFLNVDLVGNSIINLYAKLGKFLEAHEVFDQLTVRGVVSWTTLISRYTEHGYGETALHCFETMELEGVYPNVVTYVCVLKACSGTGALGKGQLVHSEIEKRGLFERNIVSNSLVNMYAKCTLISEAQDVFDRIQVRDVVSWNTLMSAYAESGDIEIIFHKFYRMVGEGIRPDSVTFLALLNTCSCLGLLDGSKQCFQEMTRNFGIVPSLEHLTSMIYVACQAGQLHYAASFSVVIPFFPDIAVWRSILSVCRKWGKPNFGKQLFENAVCLNTDHSAAYVLMSHIYGCDQA